MSNRMHSTEAARIDALLAKGGPRARISTPVELGPAKVAELMALGPPRRDRRLNLDRAGVFPNIERHFSQDAAISPWIQSQLQAIEATAYETPTGILRAEELIPIETIPRGAMEWGYDRITRRGLARWTAGYAKDLPRVALEKVRVTFPVKAMAVDYGYNLEELEAARFTGTNLDAEGARGARRAIDEFRNSVLLLGDPAVGFGGLLNAAEVPSGNAAFADWDGLGVTTPDQILQAMLAPLNTMFGDVAELPQWMPNTLLLPLAQLAYISSTPRSASSDTTILEWFLKSQPWVKDVRAVFELSNLGAGGTPRALYYRRDPAVVVAKVAILFEQLPPQEVGLEINVPCWARIGGTHWRAPVSARYVDNI